MEQQGRGGEVTLLALLRAILAGQQEDLATPREDLATPREDLATPREDRLTYQQIVAMVIDGQETLQAAASRSQSSNNGESTKRLKHRMSPLTPPI